MMVDPSGRPAAAAPCALLILGSNISQLSSASWCQPYIYWKYSVASSITLEIDILRRTITFVPFPHLCDFFPKNA